MLGSRNISNERVDKTSMDSWSKSIHNEYAGDRIFNEGTENMNLRYSYQTANNDD